MKLTGKNCLVTGGANGIGRAIACSLLTRGASVVVADLPGETPPQGCRKLEADLTNGNDIKSIIDEYRTWFRSLDVLVNNVGAIFPKRKQAIDGLEMTFSLNHMSYIRVMLAALDLLQKSGSSLVLNVSSSHHRAGRIDFDDLQSRNSYNMNKAYCQSKLANVMFTRELARRFGGLGIYTACIHPGAVDSSFGNQLTGVWGMLWKASRVLRSSPEETGNWIAQFIESSAWREQNGLYVTRKGQERPSSSAMDETVSRRLWEESAALLR